MRPSQVGSTLQVGKGGITPTWLEELRRQVKKRHVVKVRLLRSARGDRSVREFASDIARDARVSLLDVRGGTAVFADPPARP